MGSLCTPYTKVRRGRFWTNRGRTYIHHSPCIAFQISPWHLLVCTLLAGQVTLSSQREIERGPQILYPELLSSFLFESSVYERLTHTALQDKIWRLAPSQNGLKSTERQLHTPQRNTLTDSYTTYPCTMSGVGMEVDCLVEELDWWSHTLG